MVTTPPTQLPRLVSVAFQNMRGKDHTAGSRLVLLLAVYDHVVDGAPVHGTYQDVADRFDVERSTISKLWKAHGEYVIAASADGPIEIDALVDRLHPKRAGHSGRKAPDVESIQATVAALPVESRTTYRSAAHHAGLSRSTLHRYTQRGYLNNVTASIKPALTEAHKVARVGFCLKHINQFYNPNADVLSATFASFDDIIHLDEKIFRVMKTRTRYILAPMEKKPHLPAQSKRYVGQVMFLAAVAKPRWLDDEQRWFDGKLGLWPFLEMVPAQRSSKNRPRGTPVPTAVSVTATTFMAMLNDKLRPAIEAKWPRRQCPRVQVQQDNAPAHGAPGHWFSAPGLSVELVCQPAQSPDLNVLDLGYFTAIQALQQQKKTQSPQELVSAVEMSFLELRRETLENVFYTWAACMEQVLLHAGGNDYKISHSKKGKIRNSTGALPSVVHCSMEAVTIGELTLLAAGDVE